MSSKRRPIGLDITEDLFGRVPMNPRYFSPHEKDLARTAVKKAIQRGTLIKPTSCEHCGFVPKDPNNIHAHHEDYRYRFDVMWLCPTCHGIRHRWLNREDMFRPDVQERAERFG